jgi:hypothetical protein
LSLSLPPFSASLSKTYKKAFWEYGISDGQLFDRAPIVVNVAQNLNFAGNLHCMKVSPPLLRKSEFFLVQDLAEQKPKCTRMKRQLPLLSAMFVRGQLWGLIVPDCLVLHIARLKNKTNEDKPCHCEGHCEHEVSRALLPQESLGVQCWPVPCMLSADSQAATWFPFPQLLTDKTLGLSDQDMRSLAGNGMNCAMIGLVLMFHLGTTSRKNTIPPELQQMVFGLVDTYANQSLGSDGTLGSFGARSLADGSHEMIHNGDEDTYVDPSFGSDGTLESLAARSLADGSHEMTVLTQWEHMALESLAAAADVDSDDSAGTVLRGA